MAEKTGAKPGGNKGRDNIVPYMFKPGQSGNPRGRPKKKTDIEDKALKHADAALSKLVKLMSDADPRVALQAAQAILDRGVGKAKQSVDVDANHKHSHGSETLSETSEWIAEVLREREDSAPKEPVQN